jgi:predicted TIM-barrel fold metal-dependent hydrolase
VRIIDAHVHLYPPEVNADPVNWARSAGESHWGALCTRRRKDGRAVQGFPSVAELLCDMDEAGIAEIGKVLKEAAERLTSALT